MLDTSALVAFLRDERGSSVVAAELADACLSSVILAELMSRMARDHVTVQETGAWVRRTDLEIVGFDEEQAHIAGNLLAGRREHNLGLGDCCCLALAIHRDCPVMTADRLWASVTLPVDVRLIR